MGKEEAMKMRHYKVLYPSGKTLELDGVFKLVPVPNDGISPAIERGQELFMLDPRSIVTDDDGIAYQPREHIQDMTREMRDWMAAHPKWPPTELDS